MEAGKAAGGLVRIHISRSGSGVVSRAGVHYGAMRLHGSCCEAAGGLLRAHSSSIDRRRSARGGIDGRAGFRVRMRVGGQNRTAAKEIGSVHVSGSRPRKLPT